MSAPALFFGRRVKMLSWNLQNFSHLNSTPERLEGIKSVVEKHDPDILLFQEVLHPYALQLLNEDYFGGKYPNIDFFDSDGHGGSPGLAYMAKADFVPAEKISHADKKTPDGKRMFTRDFPEVTYLFDTESGMADYKVVNVHIKSVKPDGWPDEAKRLSDVARRAAELKEGAEILRNRLKADPQARIVWIGDKNFDILNPNNEEKAAAITADNSQLKEITRSDSPASHSISKKRLDHCRISPSLEEKLVAPAEILGSFQQAPFSYVSDHLPLYVEFETEQKAPVKAVTFGHQRIDLLA